MLLMYSVKSKHRPEVWDRGTIYSKPNMVLCEKCGSSADTDIYKLGAYLPNRDKTFGLIHPVGGIIGPEKSLQKKPTLHLVKITLLLISFTG